MEDTLVPYTVKKPFKDGNLSGQFAEYGYRDPLWRSGFVRRIPQSLARKAEQSGAVLTVPPAGAPEDLKPIPAARRPDPTPAEAEAHAGERYQAEKMRIRVVFLESWIEGSLSAEFAALGHPPFFKKGEIVSLPASLLDVIKQRGAPISTNAGDIADQEPHQHKHRVRVAQWQEEHSAAQNAAAQEAENKAHNATILQDLESLYSLYLRAAPNSKRRAGLWARIQELEGSLK